MNCMEPACTAGQAGNATHVHLFARALLTNKTALSLTRVMASVYLSMAALYLHPSRVQRSSWKVLGALQLAWPMRAHLLRWNSELPSSFSFAAASRCALVGMSSLRRRVSERTAVTESCSLLAGPPLALVAWPRPGPAAAAVPLNGRCPAPAGACCCSSLVLLLPGSFLHRLTSDPVFQALRQRWRVASRETRLQGLMPSSRA